MYTFFFNYIKLSDFEKGRIVSPGHVQKYIHMRCICPQILLSSPDCPWIFLTTKYPIKYTILTKTKIIDTLYNHIHDTYQILIK